MENSNPYIKESKYQSAKERVSTLKQFYISCFNGLLAIAVVASINYFVNQWHHPWFLWVVFGVGFSLISKAIKIFGIDGFFGPKWQNRKIEQYMQEDNYKRTIDGSRYQ